MMQCRTIILLTLAVAQGLTLNAHALHHAVEATVAPTGCGCSTAAPCDEAHDHNGETPPAEHDCGTCTMCQAASDDEIANTAVGPRTLPLRPDGAAPAEVPPVATSCSVIAAEVSASDPPPAVLHALVLPLLI